MNTFHFSLPHYLVLFIAFSVIAFSILCLKKYDNENRAITKAFFIYLLGIAIFSILTVAGLFSDTKAVPPRFPLFFIYNFIFAFFLLFQLSKKKLSGILEIAPHWLINIQVIRGILEIAVYQLFLEGITPKEVTFLGHSIEWIVGIGALPVGYLVYKGNFKAGVVYNILGLFSLGIIIYTAVFSFPTPFRKFGINYLPTYFPGVLIPLFIAPMAINFHILSLTQLMKVNRPIVSHMVSK